MLDPPPAENLLPTRRAKMVGWYDPDVLSRSAVMMTIANLFGRHSDTRLIEALASQPQKEFDYSTAGAEPFWLDYVSDIADGWNSTYAIAHAVAQDSLTVLAANGEAQDTLAGKLLVFGGDEVYPYPSKGEYERRAEAPYRAAFAASGQKPDIFALPGNHDWYDSLVAFSRIFCRPERGFAGCKTRQTRSYFAVKLPANWWLLAIDLQLGADLDEPQIRYFQDVATRIPLDAQVILCVPDPQWIYEKSYPGQSSYEDHVLRFFETNILSRKVSVFLTGDLHHYKRHENSSGTQKIVSGGGGAFLHPTHAPNTDNLRDGFRQRACYPDAVTSNKLSWRNLAFPLINPRHMWIPAALYALSAWFASASLSVQTAATFGLAFDTALNAAVRDPLNGMWLIAFVSAYVFFTDTHVRWYRIGGGVAHALSHLAAAFALGWLALWITTQQLGMTFGTVPQLLISGTMTFVLGGVAGAIILGIYLVLSLRVFGRHASEAFSALRIQDYKQWLRMRIDADGTLNLFAIAIDRVPRRWASRTENGRASLAAHDVRATAPRLIEKVVLRARSGGGVQVSGVDELGRVYTRSGTSAAT